MTDQLVSVIVPAWRGGSPPPLTTLVRSIGRTTTVAFEIIVVCNGQDEGLVDYLRHEPAVTRVAYLTQNAGVARGWNIGAHLALGEFLVFANEDLIVGPGCIDGLVACLRGDRSVGMVGPRGARWEFTPGHARHLDYVSGAGLVPCDAVSGFLFAMPRQALVEVGLFDDEYAPCSCEEIDIAQAVRRAGFSVSALGGLQYEHEWGVSAWGPDREIAWLGRVETSSAISLRNQARLTRKWSGAGSEPAYDGGYYNTQYFARNAYLETMTQPRKIRGRTEPPLVETMANLVEATGLLPPGGRVLDVGCSYGLLVKSLIERGYDAWGVDFSPDAVEASSVRERLWLGNARDMPIDRRFDMVFSGDLYEHLNDAEARILTQRIRAVSDVLVTIVNKSRHEPSHVNIKSNRGWLTLFAECGLGLEIGATARGRRRYLRDSAGTEDWHVNLLVLSKRRHSRARNLAVRLLGDGTLAWRLAGQLRSMWRGAGT